MLNKSCIYLITNKVNGKLYVGQTISSLKQRLREHKCKSLKGKLSNKLSSAIREHGIANFHIQEILTVLPEEADEVEEFFIWHYQSFQYGYNSVKSSTGKSIASERTRKLQSDSRKRLLNENPGLKEHLSKIMKGHSVSEETRNKIREKRKLQIISEESKEYKRQLLWITNGKESKHLHKDLPLPNGWSYGRHKRP